MSLPQYIASSWILVLYGSIGKSNTNILIIPALGSCSCDSGPGKHWLSESRPARHSWQLRCSPAASRVVPPGERRRPPSSYTPEIQIVLLSL